jgi:hypothetical protein
MPPSRVAPSERGGGGGVAREQTTQRVGSIIAPRYNTVMHGPRKVGNQSGGTSKAANITLEEVNAGGGVGA